MERILIIGNGFEDLSELIRNHDYDVLPIEAIPEIRIKNYPIAHVLTIKEQGTILKEYPDHKQNKLREKFHYRKK